MALETNVIEGEAVEVIEGDTTQAKPDPKIEVPVEQQMLEGIKAAVTKEDPAKVAERKAADDAAAALAEANRGKTPEEIAAVAAEKKTKNDAEAAAKLKARKAEDFVLTPEEKKILSQPAQARFQELVAFGKAQQAEAQTWKAENERLTKARDTFMSVYDDYKVEPEDLVQLLEYNLKLKTGDLQGALAIVNEARVNILKALGKEEPGVDLLTDFPDLKGKVDSQEMLREHALELAAGRRREAAAKVEQEREQAGRKSEQTLEQAQNQGLAAIEEWTKKMAAGDIDYKAKEAKITPKIEEIIKANYDKPFMWLELIRARYEGIEIVKPAATATDAPLRPSGAKPGAKQYSELTADALKDGLRSAGHPY